MVSEFVLRRIAMEISGDIVWSDNPGGSMRKWRSIFKASQVDIARLMGVSPSVVSDYEKNRRIPGSRFVKKFVESLIELDRRRGWIIVGSLAKTMKLPPASVIDIKEFSRAVKLMEIVEAVKGTVLYGHDKMEKHLYGYTVLDSILSIESMSGYEFYNIMGLTTERALVFTNVGTGRSPMVAVRVSPLKPGAVIVHGPRVVDPLAIKLAEKDGIPFILSRAASVSELVHSLGKLG